MRVQRGSGLDADHRRLNHTLWDDLNVAQFEVLAGSVGIALNDDCLGMLQVGKSNIIPARIRRTRSITRSIGIDRARKVRPGEVFHFNRCIVDSSCGHTVAELSLRRALVEVALRHEDGESNIIDANVLPANILDESLATDPRLESGSIDSINYCDIFEADVGNIGKSRLILAQGPNAHTVTLVANGVVLEDHIVRAILHSNGIITIINHTVGNSNVCASYIKSVSVEGERPGRLGINESVANIDVVTLQLHIPGDGLPRLEILQSSIGCFETHQMRPRGNSSAIDGISIPPGLAIGIDPSIVDVG